VVGTLPAVLDLRPATIDDVDRTFEWANDPTTRSSSFSPAPIPREGHERWWRALLVDPMASAYIGEVDGEPMGLVRFEGDPGFAVVSVVVAPSHRGRGLAAELIAAGSRADGRSINAYVITDNVASAKAFTAAGYRPQGRVVLRGREALRLDHPRRSS
jgi:RimJ/RimL family protein N-acetyltransferase